MEEKESLTIETIEMAGEIVDEPILNKTIRELKTGEKMEHRKVRIEPAFCRCGQRVGKENVSRCSTCGKLQCQDCGALYTYHGEIHCRECLRKGHDIFLETKKEFMILLCILKEITGKRSVFQTTGIPQEAVEGTINKFLGRYVTREKTGFIERLFPRLRVTNLGRDALGVYDRVFGSDPDCQALRQKILELEREKTERKYSICPQETS